MVSKSRRHYFEARGTGVEIEVEFGLRRSRYFFDVPDGFRPIRGGGRRARSRWHTAWGLSAVIRLRRVDFPAPLGPDTFSTHLYVLPVDVL